MWKNYMDRLLKKDGFNSRIPAFLHAFGYIQPQQIAIKHDLLQRDFGQAQPGFLDGTVRTAQYRAGLIEGVETLRHLILPSLSPLFAGT